jgi:hypothetical protein
MYTYIACISFTIVVAVIKKNLKNNNIVMFTGQYSSKSLLM